MAQAPIHGYSGKPLFQKMGLKPGMTVLTISKPAHYAELVAGAEDVTFRVRGSSANVVHLFCANLKALETKVEAALGKVAEGGMLLVSWPKKSSPLFKDLTEDDLRRVILPLGFVDVKVCAVDAEW